MYIVVTKYESGRKRYYVVDEHTNEIIGVYFTREDRAERLKKALNRELRREKCNKKS